MAAPVLRGAAASPGVAVGPVWRRREVAPGDDATVAPPDRGSERDAALAALAAAAGELAELATGLRAEDAEIVEAGVLMAGDPALAAAIEAAVLEDGLSAAAAIAAATTAQAAAIAAVDDPTLAARADDVRSLGRRAVRLTRAEPDAAARPPAGSIVIAADLGPADVAEVVGEAAAVALAGGGATAHAAIVARSLGLPMVSGLGSELLSVPDGRLALLDGDAGRLTLDPAPALAEGARAAMAARWAASQRSRRERSLPAQTLDGHRVGVLVNVAGVAELDLGLRDGAEGVGLLRTELAFLDAPAWPTEAEHLAALEPILAGLDGRPAIVRVLDFGGDKAPPFLGVTRERGIGLLLRHPDAFVGQLRAILLAGQGRDVRILLPLVDRSVQLVSARGLVARTARELGLAAAPSLGAMVETPAAAGAAWALATRADFLSIGTNDLTASTLGADRFAANEARAHHPRVLALIERTVAAAHEARIAVEVCGEAASDPVALPLLVGLGVDELSVGAARVGTVRRWVRGLDRSECGALAARAVRMGTAEEVADALEPIASALRSMEAGDAAGERVERGDGILAFGA